MSESKYIRRAETTRQDEEAAVADLASKLHQPEMAGVIFFCSPEYHPDRLSTAIQKYFNCPVIGCTTAGEICTTFQQGGMVGLSLSREMFRVHTAVLEPLDELTPNFIEKFALDLESKLEFSSSIDAEKMFGFLLIDGLSYLEEQTIASIYTAVQGVPIIGGSAGDNLKFEETRIFADGRFRTGAAVFSIIETLLPFKTFKLQHFEPSELDMVVTEADAAQRIVSEINGSPAGSEYAHILGKKLDNLSPQVFAAHPLMLQIGNEWYVRSIARLNDDGCLVFACAIDEGLPLTVAEGVGFVETLRQQVNQLNQEFSSIELTLGCDCVFRLLEVMQTGIKEQVEEQLRKIKFIGFNTYGEQFNAIHVNQTLTGVVIGELH